MTKPKTALIAVGMLGISASTNASAQWIVDIPPLVAQTIINTHIANEQADSMRKISTRLGDASQVKNLPGSEAVSQSLATTDPSKAPSWDISYTGQGALNYDGNKLYATVGDRIVNPDGSYVDRRADQYRKYESAHQNVAHYLSVLKETESRRGTLLQAIKETSEAITVAKNIAEVTKLQVVAATQIAALSAIDGERAAALGSVMARSLANDTDTSLQEKARAESRSVEMQFATKKFSGFLSLPISSSSGSKVAGN